MDHPTKNTIKITFNINGRDYSNWRKIINGQRSDRREMSGEEWGDWVEKEWQCKVEFVTNGDWVAMNSLEFDEKDYCMAVLKYGAPNYD